MLLWYDVIDDHGTRLANTVQAFARWWLFGASHEATDTLHWTMCFVPYQPGGMVVTFNINSFTFFYIVDNRLAKKIIITLPENDLIKSL